MRISRVSIALCWVAAAVSVLAWNPAWASNAPSPNSLCTLGVGVGLHGFVIEPCERPSGESFTSVSTMGPSGEPSPHLDPIVAIESLFARRLLLHDSLISMIP